MLAHTELANFAPAKLRVFPGKKGNSTLHAALHAASPVLPWGTQRVQ
jgi:hypothetical protein